jgi:para-nitrobenzyl esterase
LMAKGSRIEGRSLPFAGGAVFKGIPFAQPPVGQLRWREPQPVESWIGALQAGDYPHPCMQPE